MAWPFLSVFISFYLWSILLTTQRVLRSKRHQVDGNIENFFHVEVPFDLRVTIDLLFDRFLVLFFSVEFLAGGRSLGGRSLGTGRRFHCS